MRLAAGLTFCNVRGPTNRCAVFFEMLCVVIVLLSMALMGCQSASEARRRHCFPRAGMSVDQLAVCGCFLAGSGAYYSISTADTQTLNDAVTISIVSYMCPLGEDGIARVSVKNGVATQVFY